MNFKQYQDQAWSFALPEAQNFYYAQTGLVGEVGELMSLHAKAARDGLQEDYIHKVKKELGDILWFVAANATMHGFDLQEIADGNIKKLQARKEFGTIRGSGDDR